MAGFSSQRTIEILFIFDRALLLHTLASAPAFLFVPSNGALFLIRHGGRTYRIRQLFGYCEWGMACCLLVTWREIVKYLGECVPCLLEKRFVYFHREKLNRPERIPSVYRCEEVENMQLCFRELIL